MEMLRIRYLRKEAGKTMKDVADELGIDESHYCNIETSKRNPGEDLKGKIEKYFGRKWPKLSETVTLKA